MQALWGKKKRAPGGALVAYTSRHGQTQRYAERIGEVLDATLKEAAYVSAERAATYDVVVIGCCVYRGQVQGLDAVRPCAQAAKRLVVFTCGILDPQEDAVREALDAQVNEALGGARATVFHLRGSLRWRSLGVRDLLYMRAWCARIAQNPARSASEAVLLDAQGGLADFSDEVDLKPLVMAARGADGGAQ